MPDQMESRSLTDHCIQLDVRGEAILHRMTGDFWTRLAEKEDLQSGHLIMMHDVTDNWPHWEMHSAADEILVLLEGRAVLLLQQGGNVRKTEMTANSAAIVPAGIWHSLDILEKGRLMTITHGPGTEHRDRAPSA